jgi:3-oxoacid CoA-transferase subunit A
MDKVVSSAAEAIAGISSGMSLAVGGFGLCGIPSVLIQALHDSGVDQLEVISNNCGVDDWGLGILLMDKRIRRMVSSTSGRTRSSLGSTSPASWRSSSPRRAPWPNGCGPAAPGSPRSTRSPESAPRSPRAGLPWKYHADGTVAVASPKKETREFEVDGAAAGVRPGEGDRRRLRPGAGVEG